MGLLRSVTSWQQIAFAAGFHSQPGMESLLVGSQQLLLQGQNMGLRRTDRKLAAHDSQFCCRAQSGRDQKVTRQCMSQREVSVWPAGRWHGAWLATTRHKW